MLRTPKDKKGKPHIAQQHAPKQEKRIAEYVGGRVTRGSGRGNEKGDARNHKIIRVENKCTAKKSFSLTTEMLNKIEAYALQTDEAPAMQIEFLDPVTGKVIHSWSVVPNYILAELVAYYESQNK